MILLDLTIAQPPETGVHLVSRLAGEAIASQAPDSVAYLAPDGQQLGSPIQQVRAPASCRRPFGRLAWQQLRLPSIIRRRQVTGLFAPAGTMPLRHPCRTILLVHDLIALTHPTLCRPLNRYQMRSLGQASIRTADHLVVATRTVADEILNHSSRTHREISVLPFPVDPAVTQLGPSTKRVLNRLFFCGTLEARKGIDSLLHAFRILADSEPQLVLRLAGRIADSQLAARLSNWQGPGSVELLGYLPRRQMLEEMRDASCCLLPSHAEGFGLPVLEAMTLQTPIVHSDLPALNEVANGHGFSCSPESPESIAVACRQALLANSEHLADAARYACRRHWSDWGAELVELYR